MELSPVLHSTRNDVPASLGQSAARPYLQELSNSYAHTLIAHEKAVGWQDEAVIAQVRRESESHGVTRMAEALGTGVPVIANAGVGDVAKIITDHRVGILVEETPPAAMTAAYQAYLHLQQDPDLPTRCRKAAEAVFSLEAGTKKYRELYRVVCDEESA